MAALQTIVAESVPSPTLMMTEPAPPGPGYRASHRHCRVWTGGGLRRRQSDQQCAVARAGCAVVDRPSGTGDGFCEGRQRRGPGSLTKQGPSKDLEVTFYVDKDNGVGWWYYDRCTSGPWWCTGVWWRPDYWYMLNAYCSGGIEGVHWKYTDNVNYHECLVGWKYYSKDDQNAVATIQGRTTTQNDSRPWCALRVCLPGGVQGKQWEKCECGW